MPLLLEKEPDCIIAVNGRGLDYDGEPEDAQFDFGSWHMSLGTLLRIRAAIEYTQNHQSSVKGIVISGGYSKWQPAPPDGVREGRFMHQHVIDDGYGDKVIGVDEDAQDTFDNAKRTAEILKAAGIEIGPDFKVKMPSGESHWERQVRLSARANGIAEADEQAVFERIPVEEDGPFDPFIERAGMWVLRTAIDHVGGLEPGDMEQFDRVHDKFDKWNKLLQGTFPQKFAGLICVSGAWALRGLELAAAGDPQTAQFFYGSGQQDGR